MFDFKFDWSREMESGIKSIDEQHKELFRVGRDIEQLIVNQCKNVTQKEILNIVCQLREYVSYHFYTEEELMKNSNYPQISRHKDTHNAFKESIIHINLPELGKNPTQDLPKIKEIMQDFLFHHVLTEDKEFCDYLKACDKN